MANVKSLADMLECPDCGSKLSGEYSCAGCGRIFEAVNGVIDLMPLHDSYPPLGVYSDPDYRKYISLRGPMYEFFYNNRNPVINRVQCSGYRSIRRLLPSDPGDVLECGSGIGMFLRLFPEIERARFVMSDIDMASLEAIQDKQLLHGVVRATNDRLPFATAAFDTVVSHSHLEHAPYLDVALMEISRVLRPDGCFLASIPTEGGLAWTLGRALTSARHFSRIHGIDYIRANLIDHCNTANQVERALRRYFRIIKRSFFPFWMPSFNFNFTVTYLLRPLTLDFTRPRE